MATEIIRRYMFCKPAAGEVGPGATQFNAANSEKHFPVTLAGVPDSDTGLPVVKVTRGNTTEEVIFGKFSEISARTSQNEAIITVAVEGEDMRFRREVTALAVTAANVGQGIQGSATTGDATTGIVSPADVAADTRGVIIGGNTSQGTADAPGFFRVNFRSS